MRKNTTQSIIFREIKFFHLLFKNIASRERHRFVLSMHEYLQTNSTGTRNLLNRLTRRCCQNKVISKLEKKGRDDFCNLDDSKLEATPNISFHHVTSHFRPSHLFSLFRCTLPSLAGTGPS